MRHPESLSETERRDEIRKQFAKKLNRRPEQADAGDCSDVFCEYPACLQHKGCNKYAK